MTTALYVTTKQFCKRAWLGALLAVGTLVLGPLAFLLLTRLQGLNLDYMEHDLTGYHFAYLGLSWVCFLGVCLHAQSGCQKLCMSLPVSSRAIASWMMFTMVGLVVLLELLTSGAYRMLFFDEHWLADYWPLLGPLLFIVTLILVGHCLFWMMQAPSFTRVGVGLALIAGLFYWFVSRYYPNGFEAKLVPWSRVSLGEFVSLQLVCVAAWYQGTRAFADYRSGIAVPSPAWERMTLLWNGLLTGAIPDQPLVPLSKSDTLAKLHWRDSCHRAVIFAGILFGCMELGIVLALGAELHLEQGNLFEAAEGCMIVTMMNSFIASILVAFLLGDGICAPGRSEMRRYLAIAPLVDQELNRRLFRNLLKTCVCILAIIFGVLLLSLAINALLWGPDLLQAFFQRLLTHIQFFVQLLLAVGSFWIIAANAVSVLWTGRTWFINSAVGVVFGGLIFYIIAINLLETTFRDFPLSEYIVSGMLLLVYALIVGGMLAAYAAALYQGLISNTKMLLCVAIFCLGLSGIVVGILNHAWQYHGQVQWALFFIYSALLALLLTPFATIPLALRWNRHR
ncbi:hypothetical protein Pan153_59830 [Gimesia panareensis]|uniref:Uncharacterized protein n=1 Tax=Gimesia panareensis TaxID=2527978 RepID=A0A518FY48_9PLAN|nr:hypothetical protein [Gimesia panareensis]QDV21295.1 hypothetical protein Pan153_59830 [Gimesia panareensis]